MQWSYLIRMSIATPLSPTLRDTRIIKVTDCLSSYHPRLDNQQKEKISHRDFLVCKLKRYSNGDILTCNRRARPTDERCERNVRDRHPRERTIDRSILGTQIYRSIDSIHSFKLVVVSLLALPSVPLRWFLSRLSLLLHSTLCLWPQRSPLSISRCVMGRKTLSERTPRTMNRTWDILRTEETMKLPN